MTSFGNKICNRISHPVISTLLKSLQGIGPTVLLTLCQRCHDDRITCMTKMICVLGDMSYVTWGTIFVNTSGRGDYMGSGGPSLGNGAPQTKVRVHYLNIPVYNRMVVCLIADGVGRFRCVWSAC